MEEIDIFCRDGKCPVCGSLLLNSKGYERYCDNGCYSISSDSNQYYALVFSEIFGMYSSENNRDYLIIEKIQYWKENDRYLMKIMTGEKVWR